MMPQATPRQRQISAYRRAVDLSPLFVLIGESNAGGIAVNADLSAAELAPRSSLQILNNTTSVFEPLDIDTNNLIGHSGLTANATHGLENGLAHTIETGRWSTGRRGYIIKCGQGSSVVANWAADQAYWTTAAARISGAYDPRRMTPYVIISLGINDAISATDAGTFQTAIENLITRLRSILGATCRVIITNFQAPLNVQAHAYNDELAAIAAADSLTSVVDTAGLTALDAYHWDSNGMRVLADRITDIVYASRPQPATPTILPAVATYTEAQSATISADGQIRYTIDGSEPSSGSPLYTSPISIEETTRVRAISTRRGSPLSDEVDSTITIQSFAWVQWGNLQNATQDGDWFDYSGSTPAGGTAPTAIDVTQPFRIIADLTTQTEAQGTVVYLDDDNLAQYAWTQPAVAGFYRFSTGIYSWVGTTGTNMGALTLPSWVSMLKDGDDIIVQRSSDSGETWTTIATLAGALSGHSTLYLKTLVAISGDNRIRVGVET
jgi:hypothetical protein